MQTKLFMPRAAPSVHSASVIARMLFSITRRQPDVLGDQVAQRQVRRPAGSGRSGGSTPRLRVDDAAGGEAEAEQLRELGADLARASRR